VHTVEDEKEHEDIKKEGKEGERRQINKLN
jgi:hypothetical protein